MVCSLTIGNLPIIMRRILLVDDQELIVFVASKALERSGFETIVATSAKQALERWDNDIDLLLTDCVMPDLFGDELAARLLKRKPSLKVIFMSANPIGSLELSVSLEDNVNFLQKPFNSEMLLSVVGNALGLRSSGQVQNRSSKGR
jgi:two-component system, cell cycle sensor histidine kinase and response regulator CckA